MTCWPLSRHFSGFGSFFLHLRNSTFSEKHLVPICFDAAVSTADVGIGFPVAPTALVAIFNNNLQKQQNSLNSHIFSGNKQHIKGLTRNLYFSFLYTTWLLLGEWTERESARGRTNQGEGAMLTDDYS